MNEKLPVLLAVIMATIAATLIATNWNIIAPDAVEVHPPLIERDIYLPGMEFTTLPHSKNATLQLCTNSSNRIVYEFALATFAGNDEDLRTLGRIAFQQCLKVYSLHVSDRA